MADQLFDMGEPEGNLPAIPADAPLPVRMRPRSLGEVIGQEHVLGEGSALRTAIESGKPHSAILYGPPGAGKTTLARIAATWPRISSTR
ncbi:MAG TPA: ATP-binding protein [Solirubrobacterales bacterium]|nr:ATP-binding protein [Solirubrobacterales bacterium]